MMIPSENYMINNNNNNPCPFPSNNNILITMTHNNNGFFGNFPVTQPHSPFQDIFAPQPSCILSYNSTSDEAEEEHYQQPGMIDERKKRRMISNRESARRSRMRKQKHLDELCSQVMRLRMENQNLVNKLNQVAECHDRVQRENTRLKEEASNLHQMVSDLRIGSSPFSLLVADLLEDVNCNTAHLRAESSNQSMISSSSLLQ